jgi:deoxyadenosine/deoxycytidine kinase
MTHAYKDPNSLDLYWNSDVSADSPGGGVYIAITGNTGSGKSTLVAEVTRRLREKNMHAIGINERVIHHPLLDLMFHKPEKYAFGIQLNFLVQRHLILSRWLELGYVVVVERSHLDDRLFMETHLNQNNVNSAEFIAYDSLFEALARRLPEPDYIVFLDAHAELSLARLKAAEAAGERPEEFPDEETKRRFVVEWRDRFQRHYSTLLAAKAEGKFCKRTEFSRWPAETATSVVADSIISALG